MEADFRLFLRSVERCSQTLHYKALEWLAAGLGQALRSRRYQDGKLPFSAQKWAEAIGLKSPILIRAIPNEDFRCKHFRKRDAAVLTLFAQELGHVAELLVAGIKQFRDCDLADFRQVSG